ncbi:MAG TPA: NAD(P)-dependent oxidoreductase [Pirellulales bacterium]|nr:NAD(P)-dependent oxidoreductase [Pirellulales bacterium]
MSSSSQPRLLVIGATGFVGAHVAQGGGQHFEVFAGSRQPAVKQADVSIDITSTESIRSAFDQVQPTAVILTAALADIDRCEREQDLAERINHQGPRHVAEECRRRGARLVFTSTDAVFDGSLKVYPEDAAPTPVNFYGRTKARAEAAITEILPAAAIVRVSLVLGRGARPGTNSYVDKLATSFAAGQQVITPTFEYRNPIDVGTLAGLLVDLAGREAQGIFHVGASDKIVRYELARRIAVALGASPELVVPQTAPVPGRAPRGIDDFLVCRRLPALTGFVPPTCQQVIERAVHGTA